MTGIAQGLISKWERGVSTPSIAELAWLEERLDLPTGVLFASAGVVTTPGTMHAIEVDENLDAPERDFVQKAYRAARLITERERAAGDRNA